MVYTEYRGRNKIIGACGILILPTRSLPWVADTKSSLHSTIALNKPLQSHTFHSVDLPLSQTINVERFEGKPTTRMAIHG